ncbi:hypothetical protein ACH4E8_22700 [Streptomyces sp. NPDC017979]|uniref:hypothetical protein n=1 Tax=Streptomyces sp. NPDC017979 TaxID=3365024 RepID=UPI0037977065
MSVESGEGGAGALEEREAADLPSGWSWAELDDLRSADERPVTDGPFGSNLATRHYTESGPRVLRLQNIGDGVFRDVRTHISMEHFKRLTVHEAQADDLVIASLGDDLPRACIVPEDVGPAIVKADCIRFRAHPEISTGWLLRSLIAPATKRHAAASLRGIGRARLGLNGIRSLPVPVPPAAEQRRIADALDERLARLDLIEARLRAAHARLSSLRDEVLTSALQVVGDSITSFGDVLSEPLTNGRSVPTSEDDDGFPVLRLTALTGEAVDLTQYKYGEWSIKDAQPFLVRKGDFLVCRGNGSLSLVGRGALVPTVYEPVAFPDTMIRIRTDSERVLPRYLHHVWSSPLARKQIERGARTGTGIYKVNQNLISGLRLPFPEPDEQEEIADHIDQALARVEASDRMVTGGLTHANALRRTLLAEAFTGKLVPQDPDDEPAEDLLKRIQVEREAAEAERKAARRAAAQARRQSQSAAEQPDSKASPPPAPTSRTPLPEGEQTTLPLEFTE